jgi:hypothetical protein
VGKVFEAIDTRMREWFGTQRMFWVATAPREGGHVNVSPKGGDTFAVLGPREVAYLDWTGSGIETVAHLRDDGRITLLFCAFEGPPRLVRLYGRGSVVEPGDAGFDALVARFAPCLGTRSVIRVALDRISDSCGYGVPLYRYEGERKQMEDWSASKGAEGLRKYRAEKNAASIDGLPGLRRT